MTGIAPPEADGVASRHDATDPDTHYPPIRRLMPPDGAPNVVVLLIDDVGFGASSAFGGPVRTPTFEKVAARGLKYTRFHTTALCSPTQAARFNVLPMDIRSAERMNPSIAGWPELITGTTQTFYPGMRRLSENTTINIKNRSYTVTAKLVVPESGAEGVLIAQGGAYGGWSVYATGGQLAYAYNLLGIDTTILHSEDPVPTGDQELRVHFAYDGGGYGKGGTVTMYSGDAESARAGSSGRSRSSSRSTRRPMSGPTSCRRCRATTARGGTSSPVRCRGFGSTWATTTTAISSTRSTASPSR